MSSKMKIVLQFAGVVLIILGFVGNFSHGLGIAMIGAGFMGIIAGRGGG